MQHTYIHVHVYYSLSVIGDPPSPNLRNQPAEGGEGRAPKEGGKGEPSRAGFPVKARNDGTFRAGVRPASASITNHPIRDLYLIAFFRGPVPVPTCWRSLRTRMSKHLSAIVSAMAPDTLLQLLD